MEEHKHTSDAELESLLDEALAPERPAAGLSERIVAATEPIVRAGAGRAGAGRRAVVGRVGEGVSALAAAAVIALVMLGAWALHDGGAPVAEPIHSMGSLAALERELSELEEATAARPAPVSEQIELLELHLEMAGTGPVWPDTMDPLEEAGAQAQMYSLVRESMWRF